MAGSISCIMLDICRAAYRLRIRRKASIFVRKTLQVRLRDRKMQSILQARREGLAFFDEDDACAGFGTSMQPVLMRAPALELRCSPYRYLDEIDGLKKFIKRD